MPLHPPARNTTPALLAVAALVVLAALIAAGTRSSAAAIRPTGPEQAVTYAARFPYIDVPPGPPPTATPLPVLPPAMPGANDWHTTLAYYRAVARLPPITENGAWSAEAASHACYIVENNSFTDTGQPSPTCPWAAGAAAAPNSLRLATDVYTYTDRQALDTWMTWPFHALHIIDPERLATGFGSFSADGGTSDAFRMAAVLDVVRGRGAIPPGTAFPIMWPGHNTTVYLTRYDGYQQPDPLTSCPGYLPPSGLPILLQVGAGEGTPVVNAHSLQRGATLLPHCIFDETDYDNPIDGLRDHGRAVLAARDAVVLIPRDPLIPGTYTVSIMVDGRTYTWSFAVGARP